MNAITSVPKRALRDGIIFALLVASTRVVVLLLLGEVLGAREFTSDVKNHMAMAKLPFELITGHTDPYGQYPPLLPLLESLIAYPLSLMLSAFYAIRITYIAFEALAAFFFHQLVYSVLKNDKTQRRMLLAVVALPIGWMTSVIMAQDEVIAVMFLLMSLWLVASGKPHWALVACSLGVVAAKIFLLLPLMGLVVAPSPLRWRRRIILALGPCCAIYALTAILAFLQHQPPPLIGFSPRPYFGVNAWVMPIELGLIDHNTARSISMLLVAAATFVSLALFWQGQLRMKKRNRSLTPQTTSLALAQLFASQLLWVMVLFYHVNPEYYLLPLSCLLLVPARRGGWFLLISLSLTPWLVNLFFGIAQAERIGGGEGRQIIVQLYHRLLPLDPILGYLATLLATIVLTAMAASSSSAAMIASSSAAAMAANSSSTAAARKSSRR